MVDTVSDIINGRQPRVFVIQYTRQMHEEIDTLEKMRNGKIFINFDSEGETRTRKKKSKKEKQGQPCRK